MSMACSWQMSGTKELLIKEVFNGTKMSFEGPGWYVTSLDDGKVDTLLIVDIPTPSRYNGEPLFNCYCWNGLDPRQALQTLLDLPEYR